MTGNGLDAVMTALGQAPAAGWDVPDQELVSRMRHLVQIRAMVDAALAEHLAAFDTRAAARYDGQTSTAAWLRARLRLGGGQATQLLLVARHLDTMPLVAKALAAGEITLEHAAALAHLAGPVAGPVAGEAGGRAGAGRLRADPARPGKAGGA